MSGLMYHSDAPFTSNFFLAADNFLLGLMLSCGAQLLATVFPSVFKKERQKILQMQMFLWSATATLTFSTQFIGIPVLVSARKISSTSVCATYAHLLTQSFQKQTPLTQSTRKRRFSVVNYHFIAASAFPAKTSFSIGFSIRKPWF